MISIIMYDYGYKMIAREAGNALESESLTRDKNR